MNFNELCQNERAVLDQCLAEVQGDVLLLIGSYDASLLSQSKAKFKYTGGLFRSNTTTPEAIFSPEALPFRQNTLDVIVLYHTLSMVRFPSQLLREAYFSLKEGGHLVVVHANPKNPISESYVLARYYKEGAKEGSQVYHKHHLRRVFELLRVHDFSYVDARAVLPENPVKRMLSNILPQMISGWVMTYEKQVIPLTPFRQTHLASIPEGKYAITAAGMKQYKNK